MKGNKHRADIREEVRAHAVFEPAVVQVHADQPTALFDRDLDLLLHEHRFRIRVVTDQEDERIGPANLRGTYGLDVVRSSRIYRLVQLEVSKVESMCSWAFQAHIRSYLPLSALLKLTKVRGRPTILSRLLRRTLSRSDNADATGLPRARLPANHDLDILVERR